MAKRHTESIALSKFGALVAQLESIVASASQQTPDPLLCLDLLSELLSSIEEESQEGIVQWQRKCEEALYSLLVLGARRPIRRLASSAMVRVIAKGDAISIYSRASSLQGWLADSKRGEPLSCAGVAQCLGELYHYFGRRITSGLTETANIVIKLLKFHEDFVRHDALRMLNSALEGSGPGGPSAAYSEFFRIIMRLGVNDKAFIVRYAAARCLKTFASIGGPGVGTTELESSMSHCVKALEDPVSSVRDAFAEALGALLALARNPIAQVNKRGKDHSVPAKKLEDSLQKYLLSPFTRATGVRAKDLRIGLTLSWVSFLQLIHLKYHLPYEEFQNFAILSIDMLQASSSTDTHALACVLYILRVGAADQMTESNQRSFLVHLARKLDSEAFDPFFGVATLRILSYLLTTLGEVPSEFKDIMDDTVFAALSHSSLHVRIEAALTLRALAEVDTNSVGGLTSYCVTTLYALRESAANGKGDNLENELFSLHGQAAVVAALTSISPRLPLGYPSRMPKLVLDVSKKMLTEFSWNPTAATVEMDAGWLLLAALVASMPKEELADQIFDILLLWADPFVGGSHSRTRKAQDFISELWVLSAAIEALVAFIRSFVSSTTAGTNGIFLHPVLAYLRGALSHLSTFIAMNLPNLRSAIDLFTIRILMAFQSLSDPMSYKSEHPQILQICMTPFCDPSFGEESSCLKFLLDKRDACLGPWIPGRDSFEDELRSFDGGEDGIMPCVWEELISFPQPFSLSKMLVNQMLLCLGAIFSCQDDSGKALILSKIDHCLKAGKKQFCHLSSITNACVALLAGLKAMLGVRVESCGSEILSTLQSIFMGILAENEITSAQRRACAEGLGLLARLGSDSFTASMAKNLLGELVSATDSYYIGSAALSLGCIHRSVGGMALSSLVPATVASLSSIAKSSNSTLQLWSLHALLLTIEASGLSFVSQVQATLFLVMEILLCEENGLVELRQEIGCIVNAIIAVLGPELAPRSTFFSRCKSVITEISSCQEISALLESVRFTQQLVLFAPHAVSIHTHVQSLLPTLSSRQPSLRYLAVSTLRHLIEKYPNMAEEKIEEELFRMLDEETDSEIGNLVRSTINRLLYASCPFCPSRWLSLLRKMVLSASTMNNAENGTSIENELIVGGFVGGSKLYFGQDDEDMIGSSSGESLQDFNFVNKRNNHLRYRTRLFAAECLSHLPEAVGANPIHFDLSLANSQHGNGSSSTDWLVFHLQEIISLSYQISTGKFVGLQSIGVELLSTILEKFGKTQDPDLPGHLLLEQYQAQFVSAVRSAIGTSSGPLLLEAGLLLATKVLTSSILSGDRVAVRQMFSLISKPLDEIKDMCYPSYAEWVTCKIKVRLLAAHASIKRFLYQFLREEDNIPDEYLQLASLLSNSSIISGKYWISILKDYVFISSGLNSKPNYKPFLDGIQSPLVSSKVRACLAEAWPLIMEATSLDAVPLMLEVDHASEVSSMAAFQKSSFISGHSMVRLGPSDYSFLWGLSCLTLFQGQRPLSAKHARPILSYLKSIYDCDSVVKETHGVTSTEIALLVFQSLSQERFFHPDYLTLDLCKELLQFLIYDNPSDDSWNRLVVGLLSQIVQFCPNAYFEVEDFTGAALELFFKCLSAVHSNMFPEDEASFTGLFSQLFIMAEGLVGKMNHKKNQQKMVTALISLTSKWFREASTKLCLSKVLACLHDLMQFLRGNIKDEAGCFIDDHTHVKTVILNWSSMLAFISQDCSKRIHILDNKMDDLSKLLGKILSLCLEEAVALAKFIYQNQIRDSVDSYQQMLLSVLRVCIRCIQDALCDSDKQVQTAGLNLLKLVAQRELAEPSNIKGHHFFLFLGSELLGDIYSLIQHELKESFTKESISLIEESLGLLFLFHTLAQKIEQTPAILKLLLETLVMVFTISNETHSQGFQDVNAIARRLMGHLIHSPSSASQLKDVMLTMPVFRRQQLQDMIRASVSQDQMMASKLNQQSEIQERPDHPPPELGGAVVAQTPDNEYHDASQENDEEDDEDDWEAFQSLPAEAPTPSTFDTHDERRDSEIASVRYPSDVENVVDKFAGHSKWPEFPVAGNPADTEGTWSREIRKPDAKEESIDLIYPEYHEGSGFVIDASEIFHHFQSDEDFREIENKWVSKMMMIL